MSKPASKGRYKGIVKKVISGDTFIVMGPVKENGMPAEKKISIYGIKAPYRSSKFVAQEYLRKLIVGKTVDFKGKKTEKGKKNHKSKKIFSVVNLLTQDGSLDVGLTMLKEGYAFLSKIKIPALEPANIKLYTKYFDEAKAAEKGIHNKYTSDPKFVEFKNSNELLARMKGHGITTGYLEDVNYTFNLDVFLPGVMNLVACKLCCIDIPIINGKAAKTLKIFLFRNHFFQDLKFTATSQQNDIFNIIEVCEESSLTSKLLRAGFAKLDSKAKTCFEAETFKQLSKWEKEAKEAGKGIWKKNNQKGKEDDETEFKAVVVEVVAADILVVRDTTSGAFRKVYLANLKVPRVGNLYDKHSIGDSYGFEALEYVRKKLIGQEVTVKLEYFKPTGRKSRKKGRKIRCVNIEYGEKGNLSIDLLSKGFATVTLPRGDQQFASNLIQLKDAAKKAEEKELGVYGAKFPTPPTYSDLTMPYTRKKVQKFKFGKNVTGIIAEVLSATRFKVRLDKEKIFVCFQLSGVRSVRKDNNNKFVVEFLSKIRDFVRLEMLQRTFEFSIEEVDDRGNLNGHLLIDGNNFAEVLINKGFATFHEADEEKEEKQEAAKFASSYKNAEKIAKRKGVGYWEIQNQMKNFVPSFDVGTGPFNALSVETIAPFNFYVHHAEKNQVEELQDLVQKKFNEIENKRRFYLQKPVFIGTWVLAQYDNAWCRAKIIKSITDIKFEVVFVDFGNREIRNINELYEMPAKLAKYPVQAIRCGLAYIDTPPLKTRYGKEGAAFVREFMKGTTLRLEPVYSDNKREKMLVNVYSDEDCDIERSLNYEMLANGYAHVIDDIKIPEEVKISLLTAQSIGKDKINQKKKNHKKYKEYEDDYEEDYEEEEVEHHEEEDVNQEYEKKGDNEEEDGDDEEGEAEEEDGDDGEEEEEGDQKDEEEDKVEDKEDAGEDNEDEVEDAVEDNEDDEAKAEKEDKEEENDDEEGEGNEENQE